MFLDWGVCEKDKSGDISRGILERGVNGGGNHGFINSINIRRRIIHGGWNVIAGEMAPLTNRCLGAIKCFV